MRQAFTRVQLNDVSWPIRYEPLTISHAVAAFPSNPAIPYPISSWFCSHICPLPPLTNPYTSYHSSPCTILRVQKKETGLDEGVEAIIHFRAIVTPPHAPDVSYIIYDKECTSISKITMSRFEHFFWRFTAFSTFQSQYVTYFIFCFQNENCAHCYLVSITVSLIWMNLNSDFFACFNVRLYTGVDIIERAIVKWILKKFIMKVWIRFRAPWWDFANSVLIVPSNFLKSWIAVNFLRTFYNKLIFLPSFVSGLLVYLSM